MNNNQFLHQLILLLVKGLGIVYFGSLIVFLGGFIAETITPETLELLSKIMKSV